MGLTKTEAYTPAQNRLAELLRALAHPARLAIVQRLAAEGCCICRDFTDELDLAQPTVSRHLRELHAAGLIAGAVEGTRRSYCLAPERWAEVRALAGELFGGALGAWLAPATARDGDGC